MFLFQDVLVITRSVSFNDQPLSYQLCRQPIPVRQLDLEDLLDGEMRVGGSIRGAFSNTERSQYISHNANSTDCLSDVNELELNPSMFQRRTCPEMFTVCGRGGSVLHIQCVWGELESQLEINLKK